MFKYVNRFFAGKRVSMAALVCAVLCGSAGSAAPLAEADSLGITRELLQEGETHKAYRIIRAYAASHPDDFNTTWLQASVAYYTRHFARSDRQYRKAMQAAPANYYLMLDYAVMLVNTGKYRQARPLLQSYLRYDPANVVALENLSRIYYYQADYKKALSILEKTGKSSGGNSSIAGLEKEIIRARSPWISAGTGVITDDQPLTLYLPAVEAGWTPGPLAGLSLSARVPLIVNDSGSVTGFQVQAGNRFIFAGLRADMEVHAGILKFPGKNSVTWTGDLSLRKKILRSLEFTMKGKREPYWSTVAGADSNIMENSLSISLGMTDMDTWNGNVSAELKHFPFDWNNLFSAGGWIFAPPVKLSVLKVWLGLAYGYSNSPENHFVPGKSLPAILAGYDPATGIRGIYNPYFTPKDQHVGSLIGSVAIQPSKTVDIRAGINLGVYSVAMIPYLYLDKTASGSLYVARGFTRQGYFPVLATASLGFRLSPAISMQAGYVFSRTWYYTSHSASLGIKITIANDSR